MCRWFPPFAIGLLWATWYWLLITHELGHVLVAVVMGEPIEVVHLPLWGFSRTEVSGGALLVITWAGPLAGAVVPTVVWILMRRRTEKVSIGSLAALFAAASLLGNGAYLISGVGDAADLDRLGSPVWARWAVGLAMMAIGVVATGQARPVWMSRRDVPRDVGWTVGIAVVAGLAVVLIV